MILSGQVVVVVYDERVMPDGPGMAQVLEMFEANREAIANAREAAMDRFDCEDTPAQPP